MVLVRKYPPSPSSANAQSKYKEKVEKWVVIKTILDEHLKKIPVMAIKIGRFINYPIMYGQIISLVTSVPRGVSTVTSYVVVSPGAIVIFIEMMNTKFPFAKYDSKELC